jgi:hypothetical protein
MPLVDQLHPEAPDLHEVAVCTASGKPIGLRTVNPRFYSIVKRAKIAAPKPSWHAATRMSLG